MDNEMNHCVKKQYITGSLLYTGVKGSSIWPPRGINQSLT